MLASVVSLMVALLVAAFVFAIGVLLGESRAFRASGKFLVRGGEKPVGLATAERLERLREEEDR